ncbi:DUF1798 family protein [Jeotgalibacillus proteolyticus]|uniref:DUF1798 domain-containing protein n=1 Tax=Jeotgalibacillus proteolyticus TaxID=2082395 RepID=A0A2S5GE50_9BACL|nr:DUF1798 family protein [Jeotgalibacillus proteolyticus]PPA71228.1 DUF1798 domain-containing protein [Jeotgalibacillus proteolyticus]
MAEKKHMLDKTLELLSIIEQAEQQYDARRLSKAKGEFYSEVKPFADHAHALSKEWGVEVGSYLTQNRQKNLHPNQIKATVENIELIAVQCFFPETSYNRFKSYIQSSYFVVEQVKELLQE